MTTHERFSLTSDLVLAAIVVAVLACGTLLLCEVPEAGGDEQSAWPSWIARALAVKMRMTDVSDLRWYAAATGLAAVLLAVAIGFLRLPRSVAPDSYIRSTLARFLRAHWLECLVVFVILWAAASAWMNGTWALSRGWIFFFAAYGGWAVALSRLVAMSDARRIMTGASIVAFAAAVMSLYHREALGERFFQLPVGPVTLTAAFGALWVGCALSWLLARGTVARTARPFGTRAVAWAVVVLVTALFLLAAARRRAAIMGLLAAVAFCIAVILWVRRPNRRVRGAIIGGGVAFLAAGALFVRQQSISAERTASIPLKIRYTYWTRMLEEIGQAPLFGFGPDIFVAKMTTDLALVRAEEPNILHGGVDYDAHNEWWQAIYELGIPGGLAYAAIPLIAVLAACRAWRRDPDSVRGVALLACAGGLVVVFVNEAASINLRHAMMSVWYWSLVGLTAALARGGGDAETTTARKPTPILLRVGAIPVAAALIWIVATDIDRAIEHGRGRASLGKDDRAALAHLDRALGRFGAHRWLSTRVYRATALTNLLERSMAATGSSPDAGQANENWGSMAVEAWKKVNDRAAGYLDTGLKLAQTQHRAGHVDDARATLAHYLTEIDPYDKKANCMLIEIGELAAADQLQCVLRALRGDQWDQALLQYVNEALEDPSLAAEWARRVTAARQDVAKRTEFEWEDPLAVEVLRVEAFRLMSRGERREALALQQAAARTYGQMADRDSRLRRPRLAEADAWYLVARFLFDIDPRNYRQALAAVREAEKYAINSILFERVEGASESAELVGVQLLPLETPEHLRLLWQFSAMMRLAAKDNPDEITRRIQWSLPPGKDGSAEIMTELGRLAGIVAAAFAPLPANQRPESFPRLVQLAGQYERR